MKNGENGEGLGKVILNITVICKWRNDFADYLNSFLLSSIIIIT